MKIPGPDGMGTKKVSVGLNGRVYMTTSSNLIFADEGEIAMRCSNDVERLVSEANENNKDRFAQFA